MIVEKVKSAVVLLLEYHAPDEGTRVPFSLVIEFLKYSFQW